MPYNSTADLPSQTAKLPDHAKSIFLAAFNAAYKEYDKDEERAFQTAWAAVGKAGYVKKGEDWMKVSKASIDYWRHRFLQTQEHIGQLMGKEERKKILRQARAHAGGKAKAQKAKDRKAAEGVTKSVELDYAEQLSPDAVDYGPSYIDGESCANCIFFDSSTNSCEMVSGTIEPDMVCNMFECNDEIDDTVEKNLTPGDVHVNSIAQVMVEDKKKKKKKTFSTTGDGGEVGMEMMKSITVPISKADEEKRIVYGVVLEPYTIDAQEDWETPEDIEIAAHNFMKMWREMGTEHIQRNDKIYPVESYIAPVDLVWDMDGEETIVKAGSWVMGAKVEDDAAWNDVKAGVLNGFSVEGRGERYTNSELPNEFYVTKRDISSSERKAADESDFAGKNRSFPILTQADVMAAFHSLGRAGSDNYSTDQIRSNIIRIAHRKGFTLPHSVQSE